MKLINYKHLENELEETKFNLEEIVQAMTLKSEVSPKSRGASYEEIAYAWVYEIPFIVLRYRLLDTKSSDKNAISIPCNEIRLAFSYTFTNEYGNRETWLEWFKENYPLYVITKVGNAQEGKLSLGYPVINIFDALLQAPAERFREAYNIEYNTQPEEEDWIEIDQASLENYIKTTDQSYSDSSNKHYQNRKLKRYMIDALAIHKLSEAHNRKVVYPNGKVYYKIPQYSKQAHSGRHYYKGSFALQRMNSVVREAALGKCYEVDLRTSVFSYYKMLLSNTTVDSTVLTDLMSNKVSFRKRLAKTLTNTDASEATKVKLIKEAITAMGFGAKSSNYGSIRDIIWNDADRKQLLAHQDWIALTAVKKAVTELVNKEYKSEIQEYREYCNSTIDKKTGDPKKYKVSGFLAYMYQSYETQQMESVITNLDRYNPLLWVHDGVYVRNRPDLHIITHDLQKINPYANIDISAFEAKKWKYINKVNIKENDEGHKLRMAQQEALAKQKYSKSETVYSSDPELALAQIMKEQGY